MKQIFETHTAALTANGKPVPGMTFRNMREAERKARNYQRATDAGRDPLPGVGSGLAFGAVEIEPKKHTAYAMTL